MKKYIFLCLAFLSGIFTNAQVPQIEHDALIALYNSTDGLNWVDNTNWGTGNPVSTWFGVVVENIGGTDHVTELNMEFNNLVGTIPSEIGNLSELYRLVFWSNELGGTIPPELGNCSKMKLISLEENNLTGAIPLEFATWPELEALWLNDNNLSGDVTDIYTSFPNLINLGLYNLPLLTGDLNLSNCSNLRSYFGFNTSLSSVNLSNGNNANVVTFNVTDNPNLTCIFVDDKNNIPANWEKDLGATYVENEVECNAIEFTLIPDPNFEQELIDLGIDTDSTINGRVFTSDIENINSLDVSGKNISDLTGIEDFSALTGLECQNNFLSSLNVLQNNQLRYLDASNNQLTNIDLSQNPLLLQLGLNDNQLSSIDVSINTQLTGIFLENNMFNSLNVANNQLLESLWVRNNQINNLNLSLNTDLTQISVENNQIATLNLSSNSLLNLLRCNDNNLSLLSIKNGNSLQISEFDSRNNSNLLCVEVDANAVGNIPQDWLYDSGTNFMENCTVGYNEYILENSIVVFPNPTSQTLTVKVGLDVKIQALTISNIAGQIIKNLKTARKVEVSQLATGLYFLKINTNKGTIIKKFIKE